MHALLIAAQEQRQIVEVLRGRTRLNYFLGTHPEAALQPLYDLLMLSLGRLVSPELKRVTEKLMLEAEAGSLC